MIGNRVDIYRALDELIDLQNRPSRLSKAAPSSAISELEQQTSNSFPLFIGIVLEIRIYREEDGREYHEKINLLFFL